MNPFSSAEIALSTPTGNAVAHAVAQGYSLGDIAQCVLLRRAFNHVYALHFADGRRAVARLSDLRPPPTRITRRQCSPT